MSLTPFNALHGRDATDKDLLYLQARGLPDHALACDIKLYQVKKEGANFGKWCWTWGKAFLGFHGQFPKIEENGSIAARFDKGKILPFPNETDDEKKLGFDRLNVAVILRKRALRLAAQEASDAVEFDERPAPVKPRATTLKREQTIAFPPIDDEEGITEEMNEPPTKKPKL